MANVQLYENLKDDSGLSVGITSATRPIKEGRWKDKIKQLRSNDLSQREIPRAAFSGTFDGKPGMANHIDHSGYIAVEFENIEDRVDQLFYKLGDDQYTMCAFRNAMGNGIIAIIKIKPSMHRRAWEGLQRYYLMKYEAGINPESRYESADFLVSYDPNLYYNADSNKFDTYVKKKKGKKAKPRNYFNDINDFHYILDQIEDNHTDITSKYNTWLQIAYALHNEFDDGAEFFHHISKHHPQYSHRQTQAMWNSCRSGGNDTIDRFYHLAGRAGLDITTTESKTIARIAKYGRQGGRSETQVRKQLIEVDELEPARTQEIIEKVYAADEVETDEDENVIGQIIDYLRTQYNLTYNEITMKYYNSGTELDDRMRNTMYLNVKKSINKAKKSDVMDIIHSHKTKSVNPIEDFFKRYCDRKPKGEIKKLAESIDSPTGVKGDDFMPNYVEHFLTKWMVGAVATWLTSDSSPLMLILAGSKQATGKTHYFRYILPDELQHYYAESVMSGDKDNKIMMCTKLMMMNDEMSSNSSADIETIKDLCSKQWFNLRRPYGKSSEDLNRRAALCGTSNNLQLLKDPSGNRRFIPIEVNDISHEKYNNVDKVNLWVEAYNIWKEKQKDFWDLNAEDRKLLKAHTGEFDEPMAIRELVLEKLEKPKNEDQYEKITSTRLLTYLQDFTNQDLHVNQLGMIMKDLGYEKKRHSVGGERQYYYHVRHNPLNSINLAQND